MSYTTRWSWLSLICVWRAWVGDGGFDVCGVSDLAGRGMPYGGMLLPAPACSTVLPSPNSLRPIHPSPRTYTHRQAGRRARTHRHGLGGRRAEREASELGWQGWAVEGADAQACAPVPAGRGVRREEGAAEGGIKTHPWCLRWLVGRSVPVCLCVDVCVRACGERGVCVSVRVRVQSLACVLRVTPSLSSRACRLGGPPPQMGREMRKKQSASGPRGPAHLFSGDL